jgi:dihydropteroate synthase
MAQDTVFSIKIERIFDRNPSPLVMGILNITPDSFSDGGKYTTEQSWLEQTRKMVDDGADIIDIGAYSSRPGATDISEEEELERLLPAILSVRKEFPEVLISVDTFRAAVAEKAVNAGANIINDISGGTLDEKMFSIVAKLGVPYVLMHIQGNPQTMQLNPLYENVVAEVFSYFKEKLELLDKLGVKKVILDPGFGFGKTVNHNEKLLKNLKEFEQLNHPILVGLSKKSFVNKILNNTQLDSFTATSNLNKLAVQNGAKILRVHDVAGVKKI